VVIPVEIVGEVANCLTAFNVGEDAPFPDLKHLARVLNDADFAAQ